jgi:uncharacterized protein YkwD
MDSKSLQQMTRVALKVTDSKNTKDAALTRASQRRVRSSGLAKLEQTVFQKINQYRQQQGLAALSRNSTITTQARKHSQDMATTRQLSHNGFDGRVQVIGKTIRWRGAAENVAYNAGFTNPAAQAVNGWLRSPGHLQNIVGNFNLTGIGVAQNSQGEYYFTQIFIRR